MLIPRLMLSRTITHRSIRMSVQGLAIAAALLLSSCRPVTNVPSPRLTCRSPPPLLPSPQASTWCRKDVLVRRMDIGKIRLRGVQRM